MNHAGSQSLSGAEGEVKVKKRAPCRLGMGTAAKKHPEYQDQLEGMRRAGGPRSQEPRRERLGPRGRLYRRTMGPVTFPTTSERLKRATRKSTILRGPINKVCIKDVTLLSWRVPLPPVSAHTKALTQDLCLTKTPDRPPKESYPVASPKS